MSLLPQAHRNPIPRLVSLVALLICFSATVTAQEKSPERGFRPAGSYALSDIETISTTSGNMMLKVPLAGLSAGRGGLSASLSLLYNSKPYDTFPTNTYVNHSYYDVTRLKQSQAGGWRYGFKYELYGEGRYAGVDEYGVEIGPCTVFSHITKLSLLTPDGGKHELRLAGHTDGDGYQDVWQDGNAPCYGGTPATGTLSYYTTDGTFLRLDVEHDSDSNAWNNPWTLFLPDGGRVTGGASSQRIYDRNNNYIEIVNALYGGHAATYLNDQVGRSIIIEYESATNQDSIHVRGVDNVLLTSTVAWTNIQVRKSYTSEAGPAFSYPPIWRSVSQINLPSQAGSLSYSFGYNANGSNPTVGWGEISSITLPSGAKATYTYLQDNQNSHPYYEILQNRPTQKQLVYRPEYDVSSVSNTPCNPGTETCITDTWTYGMTYADPETAISSTITGPDSGVTTEYFNKHEDGTVDYSQSGLVYKSVTPDGTVTERYWQGNIPYGSPVSGETFYVKYEFTSIPNSVGALTQTAIKEYSYDKNGNVTRVAVFDWVPYANVLRNGQGRPYAPPAGAQPKAVTVNTYYNATPDAADSTTYDADAFQIATSPRLHRLVESSEVQTSGGTALSRTEMFYDYTATAGVVSYPIGNVTQQKSWDSTKGGITRPLVSGNSISVSSQYDSFGNPTLVKDARDFQTQSVYGPINGYSGLYPTEIRAAYGTSVQRYTTLEYDYYTGVVKRGTDMDNNVATATTYDVFGRPTLVKAAEGKTEETRTATAYSDTYRRVIVRSDLTNLGDGKLVSIQHYDQLGRIRLRRQLEDAATESETDETKGIKVQSRYLISGSNTYQVTSNPYRADYSYNAGSENTMGWSRSKSDVSGRVVEAQTFGGAALPAPWAANSTSTGTVTTSYDANFTTVSDQMGKVRRSMTNGLGQLARVDEPDASGSLGTTASPTQPTSYTYNELSNLTQVTQGGQTRTFVYSSLSRLTSATNPEVCNQVGAQCTPIPVTYQYDSNGNLTQKTDARSIVSTYVFDALNRNTTVDYSDTAINPDIKRFYDGATNGKGRFWYSYAGGDYSTGTTVEHTAIDSYDALGRPLIQRQLFKLNGVWGPTYQVSRAPYSRAGGVTSQTYPSGRTVTYGFDTAGRTSSFTGYLGDNVQRTYSTGMLYSSLGGMSKEQFGTDTAVYNKSFYNSRGQLAEIRVGTYHATDESWWNRGAIINHYSNNCWGMCSGAAMTDNNGNLKKQEVYIPHNDQASSSTSWWQGYDYDSLNRLERVKEYNSSSTQLWQQEYVLDRYGNRTIHQANTWGTGINKKDFTVSTASNRLGVPGGQSGTMTYDNAGNLTNDTYTGAGSRAYDAENRMTQAWGGANQQQFYTYNADGQRVRRKIDGVETWQIYGMDGELLAEYAANAAAGSPQKEYGYRNGQLLVTAEAPVGINVALAANGATATASSSYSGYAASGAINGDRKGGGGGQNGYWNSAAAGFPSWLEVNFNGSKSISEIDVFTVQDNYSNPSEP
ncbi:MAG: hypothetical protein ND895_24380, partial [Pyrinomonadaceae bacterium]|nr:hypothetical protein [Pyrinomonadaceae bacterium]